MSRRPCGGPASSDSAPTTTGTPAPSRQYLVIYLVGGFEDRYRSVLARLGPHQTGTGCLYLKRLGDVDQDALRELIDRSVRVRKGIDRTST